MRGAKEVFGRKVEAKKVSEPAARITAKGSSSGGKEVGRTAGHGGIGVGGSRKPSSTKAGTHK